MFFCCGVRVGARELLVGLCVPGFCASVSVVWCPWFVCLVFVFVMRVCVQDFVDVYTVCAFVLDFRGLGRNACVSVRPHSSLCLSSVCAFIPVFVYCPRATAETTLPRPPFLPASSLPCRGHQSKPNSITNQNQNTTVLPPPPRLPSPRRLTASPGGGAKPGDRGRLRSYLRPVPTIPRRSYPRGVQVGSHVRVQQELWARRRRAED